VETPSVADLVIVWSDHSDHQKFMNSSIYPNFLERVGAALTRRPDVYHADLPIDETLAAPLSAPVTEFLTCYTSLSKDKSELDTAATRFSELLAKDAEGFVAIAGGWGIEQVQHGSFAEEGGEGRRFLSFIGWESVDAHMKYRDTPEFKEAIPHLRNNVKGIEVHHVEFKPY
jgi:heme-degrading monooxygenase HmoA